MKTDKEASILYEEDEITFKEVMLKIQSFFWEVIKHWMLVGLLVALVVGFLLYKAYKTPLTYPATLTFMVNEESGSGVGGVGAILGQFGFAGGGGGEYNLDKIVELSKSMRIIREALFDKGVVNGETDYYANHLIKLYDFHKSWAKDPEGGLDGFLFTTDKVETFGRKERKALKSVYGKIKGNEKVEPLLDIGYQEETGILKMEMTTVSEDFSIGFVESLYNKVSNFYIKEAIESPQTTYRQLKTKTDSLHQLLDSKEYQLANAQDSNIGLISKTAKVKIDRLQRDVQLLTIAYGKALENLEMADFNLKSATPFFQVVDEPLSPIKPIEKSKLKAIALGGVIGGVLAVFFIIGRKLYRESMAD